MRNASRLKNVDCVWVGNATVALEQKYGGFTYIFDIGGSYLDDLRIGLTLLLRDRSGVNIECRSDVRVPQ